MLIINDLHLGVQRTGGTTPQSQQALRDYIRQSVANLIANEKEHIVVNGDLFDNFNVDISEVMQAFTLFAEHCRMWDTRLTLISGNHDASAKGDKVSSFHLLCFMLEQAVEGVHVIDHSCGLTRLRGQFKETNVWAISHQLNQSLFDLELDKAIGMDGTGKYLLLHANIKNTFAEHSDHSLNVNDEQLGNLMRAGWTVVCAHEHQGYELRGGRVIVVGNQFPTSVSDCIDEKTKRALRITDTGHEYVETWDFFESYAEIDWRELAAGTADADDHGFVRVIGEASASEAADVINTIAKFRQRRPETTFVITNAVKVEGHDMSGDEATSTVDDIRAFDIVGAILSELSAEEAEVVRSLIND